MNVTSLYRLLAMALAMVVAPSGAVFAQSAPNLLGTWLATVEGDPNTRTLAITEAAPTSNGVLLKATYGLSAGGKFPSVAAELNQNQLVLTTAAQAKIVAALQSDGSFKGTFTANKSEPKPITIARVSESELQQLLAQVKPAAPTKPLSVVELPGTDVPPNCAAFSGGFGGEWPNSGRLHLWIVRINADCTAQVVYGAAPRPSAQSKLLPVTIKGNVLSMPRPDGGTTTFERNGDILKAEYRGPAGVNNTTMQRIDLGSAAQAQVDADQRAALAVIPPSADVPAECAAYHGNWVGNWSQGGFTEQYLRVVEVRNSGDGCLVRYSYSGSKSPIPAKETAALRNGTISFVCNRSTGGTCVFQRNGDVISASYTNPGGGRNDGTFRKVQ